MIIKYRKLKLFSVCVVTHTADTCGDL